MACLGLSAVLGMTLAGQSGLATQTAPAAPSATPTPAAPTPAAPANPDTVILERQLIMQQLDEDAELLGNILAGIEPREKLALATRAIAKGARESAASFRAQIPGGQSKPEVWSRHDDFMQRMDVFVRNAEAMAKAGDAGSMEDVTHLIIDAMPCKQCHDVYRTSKKPG